MKIKFIPENLLKYTDKYKYIILIVAVGILLLMMPSKSDALKSSESDAKPVSPEFSIEAFEQKLESAFSKMEGVGKVRVILTLRTGTETVYAVEEKKRLSQSQSSDGADDFDQDNESKITVISAEGGGQSPVTVKRVYPDFKGAVIICDGADNARVRLQLSEAVSCLTGITYENITITKMSK